MTNLFGKDGQWGCRRQQLVNGKTNFASDFLYFDSMYCTRVNKNRHNKRDDTPVEGSEYLNDSLLAPTLTMAWQLHHK